MPFKLFKKYQIVKRNNLTKKLAFASVISGVLGGLVAAFTSPKSGSENRKSVIKSSYQLGEKAKVNLDKALEETRETGKHVAERAVDTAKGVRGRLEEIVSSLRNEKKEAEVEAKVESAKNSIQEKIAETADKIKIPTVEVKIEKK